MLADKNSFEGYFGSELNLYDIGDLSILTKAVAYPVSLSLAGGGQILYLIPNTIFRLISISNWVLHSTMIINPSKERQILTMYFSTGLDGMVNFK